MIEIFGFTCLKVSTNLVAKGCKKLLGHFYCVQLKSHTSHDTLINCSMNSNEKEWYYRQNQLEIVWGPQPLLKSLTISPLIRTGLPRNTIKSCDMNFNRSPAVACAVVARNILSRQNSRYYLNHGDNIVIKLRVSVTSQSVQAWFHT